MTTADQTTRLGGAALVAAGSLNFLRNGVNAASEGMDFSRLPAVTVEEAVWAGALWGWEPSHRMALASVPLWVFGLLAAYRALRRDDGPPWALAGTAGLMVAVVLFTVATVLDGFGLPMASANYLSAPPEAQPTLGWIALSRHQLACTFGGSAFAGFSLSIGLLGMAVDRTYGAVGFRRTGILVSGLAAVGYLTGLLSLPLVREGLMPTLALTHTAYVLLILLGLRMVGSTR